VKLVLKILIACILLFYAMILLERAAYGQHYPRFHRYALTRLDDRTAIDIIKDVATKECRGVYIRIDTNNVVTGAASLGTVPCDPIPVPPKVGDAPPASPIRESEGVR
jgi:hypothetical protein